MKILFLGDVVGVSGRTMVFKSLISIIKDKKINFIEVNCEKEKPLADKYDIKGYPTIKMVNKNKVIEYDAKTDVETLHQFVNSSI